MGSDETAIIPRDSNTELDTKETHPQLTWAALAKDLRTTKALDDVLAGTIDYFSSELPKRAADRIRHVFEEVGKRVPDEPRPIPARILVRSMEAIGREERTGILELWIALLQQAASGDRVDTFAVDIVAALSPESARALRSAGELLRGGLRTKIRVRTLLHDTKLIAEVSDELARRSAIVHLCTLNLIIISRSEVRLTYAGQWLISILFYDTVLGDQGEKAVTSALEASLGAGLLQRWGRGVRWFLLVAMLAGLGTVAALAWFHFLADGSEKADRDYNDHTYNESSHTSASASRGAIADSVDTNEAATGTQRHMEVATAALDETGDPLDEAGPGGGLGVETVSLDEGLAADQTDGAHDGGETDDDPGVRPDSPVGSELPIVVSQRRPRDGALKKHIGKAASKRCSVAGSYEISFTIDFDGSIRYSEIWPHDGAGDCILRVLRRSKFRRREVSSSDRMTISG